MKNVFVRLNGQQLDTGDDINGVVAISYHREDGEEFQNRGSAVALDITVPATKENDKAFNSFSNPNIDDLTTGEYYRNARPVSIVAAGDEVVVGQALLKSANSQNGKPLSYTMNIYGDNGDWMVLMQETTIWDVLNPATHTFSEAAIDASWNADGMTEAEFYVYAPVRYIRKFETVGADTDQAYGVFNMRPSLFIYWLIYRAFKQLGYTIQSNFMDLPYFRRMVMPWTWGSFLLIDSKALEVLKFKAWAPQYGAKWGTDSNGSYNHTFIDSDGQFPPILFAVNNTSTNGGFDNSNSYSWNGSIGAMRWTYQPQYFNQFGALIVGIRVHLRFTYSIAYSTDLALDVDVYKNGVFYANINGFFDNVGAFNQTVNNPGDYDYDFESDAMLSGDYLDFVIRAEGTVGSSVLASSVSVFLDYTGYLADPDGTSIQMMYFKKPVGGLVDFKSYDKFKNYKFLDLLRGLVDTFDLEVGTDPKSKTVFFEPSHPYIVDDQYGTVRDGYFKAEALDWSAKNDELKPTTVQLFSDSEREQILKFKTDSTDGGVKTMSDRFIIEPAAAKYLYSARFKSGKREMENRFFAPVVHYHATQWKQITGVTPQLIVIVPENINNTSANEAEAEFQPKLAYYKGVMPNTEVGGWYWQPAPGGTVYDNLDFPYMFAVNYKTGGENDPILSYCDEKIGTIPSDEVVGRGLLRRFFLQRMAIRDYGKLITTNFNLVNRDVINQMHRERIWMNGAAYVLIDISKYQPLVDETTECQLWKFAPIVQKNIDNCFPSQYEIINQPTTITIPFDMQYQKLIILNTDLP